MSDRVQAWSEAVIIPTYGVGQPLKQPLFLHQRVIIEVQRIPLRKSLEVNRVVQLIGWIDYSTCSGRYQDSIVQKWSILVFNVCNGIWERGIVFPRSIMLSDDS